MSRSKTETPADPHAFYQSRRNESTTLGTGLFITAEAMFFLGLIGSYLLLKAIHTAPGKEALQQNFLVVLCGSVGRTPPDQNFWLPDGLQLPMIVTALNTALLLMSSYFIYRGTRLAYQKAINQARWWYLATGVLGGLFLFIQGYEWTRMIAHGLTLQGNEGTVFAALYYTIIGTHGIHVLGGLLFLLFCTVKLFNGTYNQNGFAPLTVCRAYWFFVCFLWPVLFLLLYFE